jgi:hypothetical protein
MGSLLPEIRLDASALTLVGNRQLPSAALSPRPQFPALTGGKSYVLTVRFKAAKFANSNIYWNGSRLTFDPYVALDDATYASKKTQQQKQGVVFKWGSLIGFSAPGKAGLHEYPWSSDSTIYVPNSPASPLTNHSSWYRTTPAASGLSLWGGTSYSHIPYVQDAGLSPYGRTNNYLNALINSASHISAYTGDICHYLNENYRMPVNNEFGTNAAWNVSIPAGINLETKIFGQDTIPVAHCATFKVHDMLFPVSGSRHGDDGRVYDVGEAARLWSSSSYHDTYNGYSCYASFGSGGVSILNQYYRRFGFTVRCILRE